MHQTGHMHMQDSTFSVTTEVQQHASGFLFLGIAMLLLGGAAIFFPFAATLATEILIAWLLIVSGAIGVIQAFRTSRWRGFALSLVVALLSLGVGILLLVFPYSGILSLTLLMAAFFIVGGVFRISLAMQLRPYDHWGWLLTSGLLAILLALLILSQWPEAAAWFIGIALGIDLIFAGANAIMLAVAAQRSR